MTKHKEVPLKKIHAVLDKYVSCYHAPQIKSKVATVAFYATYSGKMGVAVSWKNGGFTCSSIDGSLGGVIGGYCVSARVAVEAAVSLGLLPKGSAHEFNKWLHKKDTEQIRARRARELEILAKEFDVTLMKDGQTWTLGGGK